MTEVTLVKLSSLSQHGLKIETCVIWTEYRKIILLIKNTVVKNVLVLRLNHQLY